MNTDDKNIKILFVNSYNILFFMTFSLTFLLAQLLSLTSPHFENEQNIKLVNACFPILPTSPYESFQLSREGKVSLC